MISVANPVALLTENWAWGTCYSWVEKLFNITQWSETVKQARLAGEFLRPGPIPLHPSRVHLAYYFPFLEWNLAFPCLGTSHYSPLLKDKPKSESGIQTSPLALRRKPHSYRHFVPSVALSTATWQPASFSSMAQAILHHCPHPTIWIHKPSDKSSQILSPSKLLVTLFLTFLQYLPELNLKIMGS